MFGQEDSSLWNLWNRRRIVEIYENAWTIQLLNNDC